MVAVVISLTFKTKCAFFMGWTLKDGERLCKGSHFSLRFF